MRQLPTAAELVALFNRSQYGQVIDGALQLIARDPEHAFANTALGAALCSVGRYDEAVSPLRRALKRDPNNPELLTNLGRAYEGMKDAARAESCYRQALGKRPDFPFALNNLGNVLKSLERHADALAIFARLVEVQPDVAEYRCNFGAALIVAGRSEDALPHLREATRLAPGFTTAWVNLGHARRETGDPEAAIEACREAIRLAPGLAEAHFNLGLALAATDRFAAARDTLLTANQLAPNRPEYLITLGRVLLDMDLATDALEIAERILDLDPENDEARMLRFNLLARSGDYRAAWPDYDARLLRRLPIDWSKYPPRWRGNFADLAGRSVLLVAEQGLGDFIQSLRFVPTLTAHCGALGAVVPGPMQRLVAANFPALRIVNDTSGAGAEFEYALPIMGLPGLVDFDPVADPCRSAYLVADAEPQTRPAGRPRIGIVWAGNPDYRNDRWRSLPFATIAPLLEATNVDWISLQKRLTPADADAITAGAALSRTEIDGCSDFLATAQLIRSLDLVISVDTAVAHLAGALGTEVWLLNRRNSDWRWIRGRSDTPWYPAMRIFTQAVQGDWQALIAEVRSASVERFAARARA